MKTQKRSIAIMAGALTAAVAFGDMWTYNSVNAFGGTLTHSSSEWILAVIPNGKSLAVLGGSVPTAATLPLHDEIDDGYVISAIAKDAFYNNTKLIGALTFPDSVTLIGHQAFSNCSGLTSLSFADNVPAIGPYAFYNCIGLLSVTLGNKMDTLSDSAFSYCTKLTEVTFMGPCPTSVEGTLYNGSPLVTSYIQREYAASWPLDEGSGSFANGKAIWCGQPIKVAAGAWEEIAAPGDTSGYPGVPLIILPDGGRYYPGTGTVTDNDGNLIYFPGQGGILITAIAVEGDTVTLTLDTPGAVILGKESLGVTGWTFLAEPSHEEVREVTIAGECRFFTAREGV